MHHPCCAPMADEVTRAHPAELQRGWCPGYQHPTQSATLQPGHWKSRAAATWKRYNTTLLQNIEALPFLTDKLLRFPTCPTHLALPPTSPCAEQPGGWSRRVPFRHQRNRGETPILPAPKAPVLDVRPVTKTTAALVVSGPVTPPRTARSTALLETTRCSYVCP